MSGSTTLALLAIAWSIAFAATVWDQRQMRVQAAIYLGIIIQGLMLGGIVFLTILAIQHSNL